MSNRSQSLLVEPLMAQSVEPGRAERLHAARAAAVVTRLDDIARTVLTRAPVA